MAKETVYGVYGKSLRANCPVSLPPEHLRCHSHSLYYTGERDIVSPGVRPVNTPSNRVI